MSSRSALLRQFWCRKCINIGSSGKTSRTNHSFALDAVMDASAREGAPARPVSGVSIIPVRLPASSGSVCDHAYKTRKGRRGLSGDSNNFWTQEYCGQKERAARSHSPPRNKTVCGLLPVLRDADPEQTRVSDEHIR